MASKRSVQRLVQQLSRSSGLPYNATSTFRPRPGQDRYSRNALVTASAQLTRGNVLIPSGRCFSSFTHLSKEQSSSSPSPQSQPRSSITSYTYEDVKKFVENPNPNRIIIDVREPSELQQSGRIPGSLNIPIGSSPDFPFLPAEEFEDKFDVPRPDEGKEVVFYCKAGVRSRAAAKLAADAGFGGKVGEYPGSWMDWEGKGGKIERS